MSDTSNQPAHSGKKPETAPLKMPAPDSPEAQAKLKQLQEHHAAAINRTKQDNLKKSEDELFKSSEKVTPARAPLSSSKLAEPSQNYNPYFPEGLREAERQLFEKRRIKAGIADPKGPRIGLALSGGGIRSATFCLGVLQALAGSRLLRKVDILSTVSGGGYAGSFLGRMFTREWVASEEPVKPKGMESWPLAMDAAVKIKGGGSPARRVEAVLDDHQSAPLQWLRESGRYLLPTGAGDGLMAGAVALRNWASVTTVIVTSMMTVFLLSGALRAALWQYCATWRNTVEIPLMAATEHHWWWSPLLILPVMALLLFTLPLGIAYWLTQKDRRDSLEIPLWIAVAMTLLLAGTGAILIQPAHPMLAVLAAIAALISALTLCYYVTAKSVAGQKAHDESKAADHKSAAKKLWLIGTFLGLLAIIAGFVTLWSSQQPGLRVLGGIVAMGGFMFLCKSASGRDEKRFSTIRNGLSRWFTTALVAMVVLLVVALVDSLGQMAYALLRPENRPGLKEFFGITGILVLFGLAPKLKLLLDQLPDHKAAQIPVSLVAGIAAIILAGALLITVSGVTHGFVWQWKNPAATMRVPSSSHNAANEITTTVTNSTSVFSYIIPAERLSAQLHEKSRVTLTADNLIQVVDAEDVAPSPLALNMSLKWTGGAFVICLAMTFVFGRTLTFINLSSYQTLYGARICRAYQGASNPQRWFGSGQRLGDALPSDDIAWRDYAPHENGGPLHIVNVTLNETVAGKSQIESQDRKGLIVALGPAGISVGANFHALWARDISAGSPHDFVSPIPAGDNSAFKSVVESVPSNLEATGDKRLVNAPEADAKKFGYHPLYGAKEDSQTGQPLQMIEKLSLQQYVGISGAAFTTGLGQGTSVAKSVVLGLANIRLGYWWDSFIEPTTRKKTSEDYVAGNWLKEKLAWMFPVQAHLVDEFLAKFRGPNSRLWYLSDGGHFENTGAYELVRRRVPCIILCDCGCDPNYVFEDLAQLVRMARVDFAAEIEFLTKPELGILDLGPAQSAFGQPEDFAVNNPDAKPATQETTPPGRPHALLGRVWYPGENNEPRKGGFSWLLVLKPGLSGDETLDVKHYHNASPDFPQESTLDQFFDEAQWESYRKLGRHIAEQITPWLAGMTPESPKP